MQEDCYDYSLDMYDSGCCLKCSNSYPGCLCHECKCKKCYWYSSPEEYDGEVGHCDKVEFLKKERKKQFIISMLTKELIRFEKLKILRKNSDILSKKGIKNFYSCQSCKAEFNTEEVMNIKVGITPICDICKNKILLNEETVIELTNKAVKRYEELNKEVDGDERLY